LEILNLGSDFDVDQELQYRHRRNILLQNAFFHFNPANHDNDKSPLLMNENHARLSPALVETIAGLSAGTISTLAVHPLDVIKTRLQSTSRPFPLPPHH
jgi:hypothetical protein